MAVSVRVDLHSGEIYRFLYSPSGQVVRGVRRWTQQVRTLAVLRVPKNSGQLAGSSTVEMNTHPGFVVGVITFSARHALWVHQGTGIYGPRGRPIRKPGGGLMKFPTGARGAGPARGRPFTYTRSVRGQRPQPFLVSALSLVMLPKGARIRTFRVRGRRG
jgi:hypothetical protein